LAGNGKVISLVLNLARAGLCFLESSEKSMISTHWVSFVYPAQKPNLTKDRKKAACVIGDRKVTV